MSRDYERAYFERGMFAAYAWMVTKKRGEQLSDAVVDHAWDHRDEGMGPTECLPVIPRADAILATLRAGEVREAVKPAEGTALGEVMCHCSDDDGVPDVGVSVGLGEGSALWIGELLTRDGGDIGLVFHGPDGERIAAPLWPTCEWQEAADILRHRVGPLLARATLAPAAGGE